MNPWNALACAAAGAAIVELDAAAAGQFMISRPIVLGPMLGIFLGEPALGAGLGVLVELFTLEDLPVGGSLPLNATAAAAAALLLALGPMPVAPELALGVGLLAGWAHSRLESGLRRRRASLNISVEKNLSRGHAPGLGSMAGGQLLVQALMTLALLLAVMLSRGLLRRWWLVSPDFLRAGLGFGLSVAPWLALWSLLRSFKVAS